MRVFLASIPLEGRKVVIVGGGEPGVAKARLLARTPAQIAWFTPDETPHESDRPAGVTPIAAWPAPEDFAGAALVFIAMFGAPEAPALMAAARAAGALVNAVDQPALCDFYTPAVVDRGDVVIGIATGGGAPILARDLRALIERVLPAGLEPLAALSREIRDTVKTAISDPVARRRYWERAFRGRAADLAAEGELDAARAELHRLMIDEAPSAGWVWVVEGPADPELLTLKALRALQDADVLAHEADAPAGVLDSARRDARRMSLAGLTAADVIAGLAAEAGKGLRVVRIVAPGAADELAALAAAGVDGRRIPGVKED
jgi:uroporphyrin-III C-methyltransferase/precorrin-2 dehydrogenase/sirohydrochlorin ferrochelatase